MKHIFILLFSIVILNSCDPGEMAYIRNFTNNPMVITVEFTNEYSVQLYDTLKSTNQIIEIEVDPSHNVFDTVLYAEKINAKTLKYSIINKSTTMIGAPYYAVDKVILDTKTSHDTIIFSGKSKNVKTYIDKGIIQMKIKPYQYAYIIDVKN